MRRAEICRKTAETDIRLTLNLDGAESGGIDTGIGFLDQMLTLFAHHSRFGLAVKCSGDTYVDGHHTVEDIGLALGGALSECLGDKRGIRRYGHIILPMDEALILCAVDLSGRPCPIRRRSRARAWAISTPSWRGNSCRRWQTAPAWRCTSASWTGRTATTSSRPCSRPWAAR